MPEEVAMQHQLIRHGQGSRTWSIRLDSGEEVNACLQDFARREILSATSFTACGAFQDAVLGYLEAEKQDYKRNALDRPTQVVSLVGDIALHNGRPTIHMRAVLGDNEGTKFDGFLLEAHVDRNLEVIMTESPVQLHKGYDADAGLALFKQGREAPQ
jgi:predicted DNA-binding protein with PD1-like motif